VPWSTSSRVTRAGGATTLSRQEATGGHGAMWCAMASRGGGIRAKTSGRMKPRGWGDSSDDFGTSAIALRHGGDGSGTTVSPA
jgi:hypothetical protein